MSPAVPEFNITPGKLADWEKDATYVPDAVPETDQVQYGCPTPRCKGMFNHEGDCNVKDLSIEEEAASRLREVALDRYRDQDKK